MFLLLLLQGNLKFFFNQSDFFKSNCLLSKIRTDAQAADLLTSDVDERDRPFITGERTIEGYYRTKCGLEQSISRGLAYSPYADLIWCEVSKNFR